MNHIKFPSIEQYKNTVKHVQRYLMKNGIDSIPPIEYVGTAKCHGTNSAFCHDPITDESWFQSRERKLSLEHDNAGFCLWGERNKDYLKSLALKFSDKVTVVIYGEWAGLGVQKGVALSELPKRFYVFAVKLGQTWPGDFTPFIEEMVAQVEAACPIGLYYGVSGIGEGIVFVPRDETNRQITDLWFKAKGSKHSSSKTTTGAKTNAPNLEGYAEAADTFVSENRLNQGITVMKENAQEIIQKNTGDFIRWVMNDIIREERETIVANNIDIKKLGGMIASRAREFYMKRCNEL